MASSPPSPAHSRVLGQASSFPAGPLPDFSKADINIADHYNTVIFMGGREEVTWRSLVPWGRSACCFYSHKQQWSRNSEEVTVLVLNEFFFFEDLFG